MRCSVLHQNSDAVTTACYILWQRKKAWLVCFVRESSHFLDLQTIQDRIILRPWLACQCKAAHCVEQCAYMWRQWPTSGPHQTCASVFLREKATHVIFGEFKANSRAERSCDGFPVSSRARRGAAGQAWSSNNWRRSSAILESEGTKLWLYIVTSYLQFWYIQFYYPLMNFTVITT